MRQQLSLEGSAMFDSDFSRKLPVVVWGSSNGWYQYVEILKQLSVWELKVGKILFSKLFNSVYYVGNSFPILRESPDKVFDVLKLYVALKVGSGMVNTYSLASDFKNRITSMYESFYTAVDKDELMMEPCLQPSYPELPYSSVKQSNWDKQKCSPGVSRQEQTCKDESSPSTSGAGTASVVRPVAYRVIQGTAKMCDKFLDYVPIVGKDMFPWMSPTQRL